MLDSDLCWFFLPRYSPISLPSPPFPYCKKYNLKPYDIAESLL